ncbi:MAG: hypothetical protein HY736_27880 [Verrucomicrobia bacterium]|nr:hypothetical protein [Verrucomicrobiota bacterium]
MVNPENLGAAVIRWARRESSVCALVLIGSQVHAGTASPPGPDRYSDWDFQIVTTRPARFADRAWMRELGAGEPLAYVARVGRLGSAIKVSAVLPAGALDLVVIPVRQLRMAKWLFALGLAKRFGNVWPALGDLALVVRAGHRVVKGNAGWSDFFQRVVTEIPPRRLSDDEIRSVGEGFVCDYVSTRNKIARGELLAAQRWLHHQLADANFRLLHELRQRRGEPSLSDARRLEFLGDNPQDVVVSALPTAESLAAAVEKCAAGFRRLMDGLVGDTWRWPDGVR